MEDSLIKNIGALEEIFIPSRVVHRDGQLKSIRDDLMPLVEGMEARHAFIHGPPGTGKTCVSKYVVGELKEHAPVATAYVNCWENSSRFKIIYNILSSMGEGLMVHRKGTPTDELLEILRKRVNGKTAVVILDEIDCIEDGKVIYDLLQAKACLIMISNSETALAELDPRIRSRLSASDVIEFPKYSTIEIAEILKDRSEWGLVPGAVKSPQLERIAGLSGGDSRAAISMLRICAQESDRKGLEAITDDLIERISFPSDSKKQEKMKIAELSGYQKLIIEVLSEKGKMESGKLFSVLIEQAGKSGKSPIVDRTFRKHMEFLVKNEFVESSGYGRWRIYSYKGQ